MTREKIFGLDEHNEPKLAGYECQEGNRHWLEIKLRGKFVKVDLNGKNWHLPKND